MRFKAAILKKVSEPLEIEEVELISLAPNDVLIRNYASGLCHTDLEVMQGSLTYPLPIVLGHEGSGIVEEVGKDVTNIKPGDHVIASWNPHCGNCFYCDRNEPILCEPFTREQPRGKMLDGSSRLRLGSETLYHFGIVSSHAQYSVVPNSGAIVVPKGIPFDRACLIGCSVMTGVGAVVRKAKTQAGDSIAVIGCGAVGLNAIQGGKIAGAERIIAIDQDPARLEIAKNFGATHLVIVGDLTIDEVKDLTAGRGADAVFEAAGAESALQLAFEITRPGGQLVILGKTEQTRKVSIRFGSMMGEKRIVRSSYGGARPQRDFPWLAELYLDGHLKLDELISLRLPLDKINEGFDGMKRGEVIRAVLELS